MAEPLVEIGGTVEKNENESISKESEDISKNDGLSKSENDSTIQESAQKNLDSENPSNVTSNVEGNEGGTNDKKIDEVKENSQSGNLNDEINANPETQKTFNDFSKESTENSTTAETVHASSTESTSEEEAGNQANVEQTQQKESDNPSKNDTSVDTKDKENSLGTENAEISTQAASTHDTTSTGDELKEEILKDVTSNNENDAGRNNVESGAPEDTNNGKNKGWGKTEEPETPVDNQSKTASNEVSIKNDVDVLTKIEDSKAKSDTKPTDEISADRENNPPEVTSFETETKSGDSQKTSCEIRESKDEIEKLSEINTKQSKEDSKHDEFESEKIDTIVDSGLISEPTEHSRITDGNSNEEESTKSNELPSSTEQAVPQNQSQTRTKIENEISSEKVEVNTNQDGGETQEDVSSPSVKEGDNNMTDVTSKLEQHVGETQKENDAEKSEETCSGNKNETVEGSGAVRSVKDVGNTEIKQDRQEEDRVGKVPRMEPDVTKDQNDQNVENKQQENIVEQKSAGVEKLADESKYETDSDVRDIAERGKEGEILTEMTEGGMDTNKDSGEKKSAGDSNITVPTNVESSEKIIEVEKVEGVEAGGNVDIKENTKEVDSSDQKQTTERSSVITAKDIEDNRTQKGSVKEDAVNKVPDNEPEVTRDVEDQNLDSKRNTKDIKGENTGNKKHDDGIKDNETEPETASDVQKSEDMGEKSTSDTKNALNETISEGNKITPPKADIEHQTFGVKVDETSSDTKETGAGATETEIKEMSEHPSINSDETATENSKCEQPRLQGSEEIEAIEKTATSVDEADQVQATTKDTITGITAEGRNLEQEAETVPEGKQGDVHQVETIEEVTDQPKEVEKGSYEDQPNQQTKSKNDKIAESGSGEDDIVLETLVDQEDRSLADTSAQKDMESKDENDSKKHEESNESAKPAVDQDNTEEPSLQSFTSGDKKVESKEQTDVSETTVKSMDQANDDETTTSMDQVIDVETKPNVDQDSGKETAMGANDERVKVETSEISEDKNAGTNELPSLEKQIECKDQNHEETKIQCKDNCPDKASDDVLSTAEAKTLGNAATLETKEENLKSITVKESGDLDAENKITIKMDESSDAAVTGEFKDSGTTMEAKEESEKIVDQGIDKGKAKQESDKRIYQEADKDEGNEESEKIVDQDIDKDKAKEESEKVVDQDVDKDKGTGESEKIVDQDVDKDKGTEKCEKIVDQDVDKDKAKEVSEKIVDQDVDKNKGTGESEKKVDQDIDKAKEESVKIVDQGIDKDTAKGESEKIVDQDVDKDKGTEESEKIVDQDIDKDKAEEESEKIVDQDVDKNKGIGESEKIVDQDVDKETVTETNDVSTNDNGVSEDKNADTKEVLTLATVKESEGLDAVIAESNDQSTDIVSTSKPTPIERPKHTPEENKTKENTKDFAVLGVAKGTKKEVKTEPKEVKSRNKCVDVMRKDKDSFSKVQDVPHTAEVTKDTEESKIVEKPTAAAEIQSLNDGKEEEEYVLLEYEDAKIEESYATDVHLHESIIQDDKTEKDYQEEYDTGISEHEEDRNSVREEEEPEEEEAKASHAEKVTRCVSPERPVVEITAEFLELMEGFCMAATQEFPSNVIDFACRYFTRIYKRRKALRKYNIEVSDLALLSDVNWCGHI